MKLSQIQNGRFQNHCPNCILHPQFQIPGKISWTIKKILVFYNDINYGKLAVFPLVFKLKYIPTPPPLNKHVHTHIHIHTDTHTHIHTYTQTHIHTDTYTHRHIDTQAHSHKRTQTHTNTHTYA